MAGCDARPGYPLDRTVRGDRRPCDPFGRVPPWPAEAAVGRRAGVPGGGAGAAGCPQRASLAAAADGRLSLGWVRSAGCLPGVVTMVMPGGRLGRILAELSAGGQGWSSARLCRVCPGTAEVTGAGVMLMSGEILHGSLCTSDGVSQVIEELQYTLGEGPCVDAYRQDTVVAEPNLADPVTRRWPVFSPQAAQAGGVRVPVAGRHGAPGGAELVPGPGPGPVR